MGKPRKTGNVLFDIFWKEYPPRINGAGIMEKKKRAPALKWFERHNPTEEAVFDMLAWLKKDKENREKSDASSGFYSSPADAIVFLNQERWINDEIGVVVTKTQRYEAGRSQSVHNNNVRDLIGQYQNIIKEWPIQKLLRCSGFMAGRRYPEFRAWAIKERPELEGAKADKADNPPSPPRLKPEKAVATPDVAILKPVVDADLPPPNRADVFNVRLKEVRTYQKQKQPLLINKE